MLHPVYHKDEAHEAEVERIHHIIDRHNEAMSRMVDAVIGVMVAYAVPIFHETRDELFEEFHDRFGLYPRHEAEYLDNHRESYEYAYSPEKVEKPLVTNPATIGFGS